MMYGDWKRTADGRGYQRDSYGSSATAIRIGDIVRLEGHPHDPLGTVTDFRVGDQTPYGYSPVPWVVIAGTGSHRITEIRKYKVATEPGPFQLLRNARHAVAVAKGREQAALDTYRSHSAAREEAEAVLAALTASLAAQGIPDPAATDNPLQLPTRLYDVVVARSAGKTFRAIGESQGVTIERIRQLDAKALRMMRHPDRARLVKLREHVPIWDRVFGEMDWQHDERLNQFAPAGSGQN